MEKDSDMEKEKKEQDLSQNGENIPEQKRRLIKKKHSLWSYIVYALAALLGIVMAFEDYRISIIYLIVLLFLFVKEGSRLWERMFALLIIALLTVYIVYRLIIKYFI